MRYLKYIFALCLPVMSACSSQQFYEAGKASQRANCLNYPEAEYRECMDDTAESYEQYKLQRDEVRGE